MTIPAKTHDIADDGVFIPRGPGVRLRTLGKGLARKEWLHADGRWLTYPPPAESDDIVTYGDHSDLDDARWLVWTFVAAFALLAAAVVWRVLT